MYIKYFNYKLHPKQKQPGCKKCEASIASSYKTTKTFDTRKV